LEAFDKPAFAEKSGIELWQILIVFGYLATLIAAPGLWAFWGAPAIIGVASFAVQLFLDKSSVTFRFAYGVLGGGLAFLALGLWLTYIGWYVPFSAGGGFRFGRSFPIGVSLVAWSVVAFAWLIMLRILTALRSYHRGA
jgi:hypothetical protein